MYISYVLIQCIQLVYYKLHSCTLTIHSVKASKTNTYNLLVWNWTFLLWHPKNSSENKSGLKKTLCSFFRKLKSCMGQKINRWSKHIIILYVAQLLNTFCNWMFVMDTHRSAPGRPWVSLSCPLEWGPVSSPWPSPACESKHVYSNNGCL